jgi:hypothetical protein
MKTTIKQIAAGTFIAILLLVGYVKATETKASSHEIAESTLQLEGWMTNEAIWNTNSINIAEFVVDTETDLILEDWMTDAESWNTNNNFIEEVENELELEDWMVNDNSWNTVNNDIESELIVENWIVDNNVWK